MSQLVTYNGIVGYVLEQRRQELGYDQTKVAKAASISQPVLSRLEKGKSAITVDQLFTLSKALQIDPHTVIERANEYALTFEHDSGVKVTTLKQVESTKQIGKQEENMLIGATIGAVLALILSQK